MPRGTLRSATGVSEKKTYAVPTSGLITTTIAATARRKRHTITRLFRRASCWCSKNETRFICMAQARPGTSRGRLGQRDLGRLALVGRFGGLQELGRTEPHRAGEGHLGEGLAPCVVLHHRVVVRLAREGDLVLGAAELLLQAEHVLVGL